MGLCGGPNTLPWSPDPPGPSCGTNGYFMTIHREEEEDVDKASGGGKKGKKGKKKDDDWYGGDGSFGCMFRHSDLTGRMKMM